MRFLHSLRRERSSLLPPGDALRELRPNLDAAARQFADAIALLIANIVAEPVGDLQLKGFSRPVTVSNVRDLDPAKGTS